VVIAPAHPMGRDGFELEARPTADGGSVLPVFSSIELLVERLGRFQPWVALPIARVRELAGAAGVGRVVLDPRMASDLREWSEGDVRVFNELRRSGE
jgi:hypothetical protein